MPSIMKSPLGEVDHPHDARKISPSPDAHQAIGPAPIKSPALKRLQEAFPAPGSPVTSRESGAGFCLTPIAGLVAWSVPGFGHWRTLFAVRYDWS